MHLPWKESHKIRTYEVDFKNLVKLSSIFNYMQEAASNNANQLKFGYNDLMKEGLFWVLSRSKIQVIEYLKVGDDLIIETWPKGTDKLFALRDFKIYNSNKDIIGNATTAWLLIDSKTIRPVKPDFMLEKIPHHNIESAILETPGKIAESEMTTFIAEKNIGYMDLDINQHVNNVKYVEYMLDSFPMDHFAEKSISSMQINFLCESKYGDTIQIFKGALKKSNYYVEGINQDGSKIFQAHVEWTE